MKIFFKKIINQKMNIPKILTYIARPEGLGLHGPILDALIPEMFCNDALRVLAIQGNLWATETLFSRPNANREICIFLICPAIENNRIEQAKFILSDMVAQDNIAQDNIAQDNIAQDIEFKNLKNGRYFYWSFNACIASDFKDMVKILLDIVPLEYYELNSYMGIAINCNNTEITKMFIEKGATDLKYGFERAIMNGNIEILEILFNRLETLETSETKLHTLEICLGLADRNGYYECLRYILSRAPNDFKPIEQIYRKYYWNKLSHDIFDEKLTALKNSAMEF